MGETSESSASSETGAFRIPVGEVSQGQKLTGQSLKELLEEGRRAECLALVTAYLEHQTCESEKILAKSLKVAVKTKERTPFHNKCQPRISLSDYVHRLAKFSNASSICFIMACAFIDRLGKVNELYLVSRQTAHRLLLSSVLLAAKLADDNFRSNAHYSKVGGVSNTALNNMELHMFSKLNFSLCMSESAMEQYLSKMQAVVYTDLSGPAEEPSRRSKKRISEDVGFGSEDDLPAKLPHGEDQTEVTVTADKHGVEKLVSETSNLLNAVASHASSRQSSLSSCAQEVAIFENAKSLSIPLIAAVPGP